MTRVDPSVPVRNLKLYAGQILGLLSELRVSFTALSESLFATVPGLKREYEKRYQDAKKKRVGSIPNAAVSEILRSIDQLEQALHELCGQSQEGYWEKRHFSLASRTPLYYL
jgi:hypothetical protein